MLIDAESGTDSLISFLKSLSNDGASVLAPDSGFGTETFAFSLQRSIDGWLMDPRLRDVNPRDNRPDDEVCAVLPSNSPAPLMNLTLAAYLAGVSLRVKPARVDRAWAEAWIEYVGVQLPGARLVLADNIDPAVPRTLVVYGSDETVAYFRDRRGTEEGFFGCGHKFSIAYVDEITPIVATAAANDVIAWDQSGCLSPQTVFVARGGGEMFAALLAEELARRQTKYPRRFVGSAKALAIRALRMDVSMRDGGRVYAPSDDTSWSVLFDPHPELESTPLERTVWVREVEDWDEMMAVFKPEMSHIGVVGAAVSAERMAEITEGADERSMCGRVVILGRMQSPALPRFVVRDQNILLLS